MRLSHAVAATLVATTALAARTGSDLRATPYEPHPPRLEPRAANEMVQRYCVGCHNPRQLRGNLSLQGYSLDSARARLDVTEKIVRKLRAQMMPPPNASRKLAPDSSRMLAETIEQYMVTSFDYVVDYLTRRRGSNPAALDPVGEFNLHVSKQIRKMALKEGAKDKGRLIETADDFFPIPTELFGYWGQRTKV